MCYHYTIPLRTNDIIQIFSDLSTLLSHIFHGKKNTYVYDTTDIRLHTKSYLQFYENIPVPLQGMEADDYEIYVVYQNEFYDLEQNIKIK